MNVYKTKVGQTTRTKISVKNFERDTLREAPYYQAGKPGKEPSYFVVCPACENPIQLLGLYKELPHTPNPYGKHYSKSVPYLAEYDHESYEFCPYSNPDRNPDRDGRRTPGSKIAISILNMLINHFDQVIYMIEESTGIKIGNGLAERMLNSYRDHQGHLYKAATLLNIPWIFAYMANAKSITRQRIHNNPALLEALREHLPNAQIDVDGSQKGVLKPKNDKDFLDINVSYIHHSITSIDKVITETMKMVVFTLRNKANVVLHEQVITFDPDHFLALINLPEDRAYRPRKEALVAMAQKILGSKP